MKNIVLGLLVLMVTTLGLSEQAFAGGGKKTGRLEIANQNAPAGRSITIWVLPEGTSLPATVGAARKLKPQRILPAQKTESVKVPIGRYVVVAVDTLVYQGAVDSTPINAQLVATKKPVVIGSSTVKLTTRTVGTASPFLPEIKP